MRRALPLAVLVLALLPAGASASPWTRPQALTHGGFAAQPQAALGGGGAAGVAYSRLYRGVRRIEIRRGTVRALLPAKVVDKDPRHMLDSPALTFRKNLALVAYRRMVARNHAVFLATVASSFVHAPRDVSDGASSYDPRFVSPDLLTFHDRTGGTLWRFSEGPATALPAGATFDAAFAVLPDGTVLVAWPAGGNVYAAVLAPGATGFAPPQQVSSGGGYARSPQLAVTSDGTAVLVWTQSGGGGNALESAARPAGTSAFGAPQQLAPPSAGATAAQAIATTAGDVFVTYVAPGPGPGSGRRSGPLMGLRVGPGGRSATPVLTLTARGERTTGAALAVDSGAAYAAWVTTARPHRLRLVRVAPGGIVGAVRTLSGRDELVPAPPSFAMSTSGRALIAYSTRGAEIHVVTRAGGA